MRFDIVTIFPESLSSYLGASIMKRATEAGLVSVAVHDLRAYTHDKHHKTDDTPYGGGPGMVMKVEPFAECLDALNEGASEVRTRTILLSAKGKQFTESDATRLAENYDRIILLCGRYEGVDERVAEHLADEELSIGPYVLTGGELPALIVTDAVTRLLPGVLGNSASAVSESYSEGMEGEYPQYTKPEEYRGWSVPPVLLSGNHQEIERFRRESSRPSTIEPS